MKRGADYLANSFQPRTSSGGGVVSYRQLAVVSLWLGLVVTTIGPVALRPSMTNDPQFDRFLILSVVGAATALATTRNKAVIAAIILLSIAALEASQLLAPGRHAGAFDAIAKSLGAMTGCSIVWLLQVNRMNGWIVRIPIVGAALLALVTASWYVLSPGLALEKLRRAVDRHDDTSSAMFQDPDYRSTIVGMPGRPLAIDVWGRTGSTVLMTIRSNDRVRALLVLDFKRHGLQWKLARVSLPHRCRRIIG